MYHHHFGFHGKPFQSAPPERAFFQSESLRRIIPVVLHTLRSDLGAAVLTGPAGIGKTSLLKYLSRRLQTDGQVVLFSAGAVRTSTAMLGLMLRRLRSNRSEGSNVPAIGRECGSAEHWQVIERLSQTVDFWGPMIVLFDDAHLANPEIFTELRSLLEEEVDGRRVCRVLISGALSLEDVLAAPAMTDFVQKIRSHVFPEPLLAGEAVSYLAAHLSAVGGDCANVFQPLSVERIVAAADGVPQCLNLLADESLLVASQTDAQLVTPEHVDEALQRLQHLPYSWNVSMTGTADDEFDRIERHTAVHGTCAEADAVTKGSTFSSDGVIEIGAPAADASSVADAASSARSVIAEHGVIEIGAVPAETTVAAADTDEVPVEPVDEFDASAAACAAADDDALPYSFPDDELAELSDSASDTADDFATSAIPDADDAAVASSGSILRIDDSDELVPAPEFEHFRPWSPPGEWRQPAATTAAVASPSESWVRLPGDVSPVPVFDRYTWLEYGRDVPFVDTVGRRYFDVPVLTAEWPPNLIGVAPSITIPVEELDESFVTVRELSHVFREEIPEPPSSAQITTVCVDAEFDACTSSVETVDAAMTRDDKHAGDDVSEVLSVDGDELFTLVEPEEGVSDEFALPDLTDLTALHPLEFDEVDEDSPEAEIAANRQSVAFETAEAPTTHELQDTVAPEVPSVLSDAPIANAGDSAAEDCRGSLQETVADCGPVETPFEDVESQVVAFEAASDVPVAPQEATETVDAVEAAAEASEAADVAALSDDVFSFEEAPATVEWHDGQLLCDSAKNGTADADEPVADEPALEEVVSLPIAEMAPASQPPSSADSEESEHVAAASVASPVVPARVDSGRLFSLPLQIADVNLSRRDGAYADLQESPVTEALLRLQETGRDPESDSEANGSRQRIVREPAFYEEVTVDQSCPDSQDGCDDELAAVGSGGRLSTEGKLRFDTLFTRLRQRRGRQS
ncbi:MAG: AAA family ATPase [Planctomycetaceae bacterium]